MKKKISNFFNFVYAGPKITTGDALILADVKNVIFPPVIRLVVVKYSLLFE